jgi:hypothetical protein
MAIELWTYLSPTQVLIGGDYSDAYWAGMLVKLSQESTTKYFELTSVTFDGVNTTLELDGHDTYSVTNSSITSHLISIYKAPNGYGVVESSGGGNAPGLNLMF